MNKNRKLRVVTYTLAAGMLIGAAGLNLSAAPLAGATAALSNNNVTTQAEATTPTHTAVAGVNLVMSANISEEAASSVSESATEAVATNAPADYTGIAIAQVNDYVNVRSVASEDGDVVGKLYNNSAAQVLATEGDWYQITSGNCTGYVKSEFVVVDNPELAAAVSRRVATVNTETLYVRSEPSTEASVITMVPLSDDLTVVDESTLSDGWVKVNAEGGDGFVSADYIVLSTEFTYAESKEEEAARLAKEEAERCHKLVSEYAEKAQAEHDEMIKLYEQADSLRKQADEAQAKFIECKKAADEEHKKHIEQIKSFHETDKDFAAIKNKQKAVRKKKTDAESKKAADDIFARFKSGDKLSTEDLMILQKSGYL